MSHWQVTDKASRAALIEIMAASNVFSISPGSAAASGAAENPEGQGPFHYSDAPGKDLQEGRRETCLPPTGALSTP